MMARLLEVSRSGFYSLLTNVASTDDWSHVRDAVERVWLESDRRFGARMVHAFLPPELGPVTLYRVRKCMRELGIRGVTPNAKKRNHDTRRGRVPEVGPGGAQLHQLRTHLQARGRHHLPAHGAGLAVPGHRD